MGLSDADSQHHDLVARVLWVRLRPPPQLLPPWQIERLEQQYKLFRIACHCFRIGAYGLPGHNVPEMNASASNNWSQARDT